MDHITQSSATLAVMAGGRSPPNALFATAVDDFVAVGRHTINAGARSVKVSLAVRLIDHQQPTSSCRIVAIACSSGSIRGAKIEENRTVQVFGGDGTPSPASSLTVGGAWKSLTVAANLETGVTAVTGDLGTDTVDDNPCTGSVTVSVGADLHASGDPKGRVGVALDDIILEWTSP
jgi:hypothetical protein